MNAAMKFQTWKKGDRAWVLNGRRESAFPAVVICIEHGIITVFNETKGHKQHFDAKTGEAIHPSGITWKGDPPLCVPHDDHEALLLNAERQTAMVGESVRERAGSVAHAIREGVPAEGLAPRFAALRETIDEWEALAESLSELQQREGVR